ncbi:MAG: hypothetical protein WCG97_03735 [bacterium]
MKKIAIIISTLIIIFLIGIYYILSSDSYSEANWGRKMMASYNANHQNNATSTEKKVSPTFSDEVIANLFSCAEDKSDSDGVKMTKGQNGTYGCKTSLTTEYITSITHGDINNDGYEDALVEEGHCGASCGTSIYAVLNQKNGVGKLIGVNIDSLVSSGASQTYIKSISIKDGVISIKANGFKDSANRNDLVTKNFRFDGRTLIEIKG